MFSGPERVELFNAVYAPRNRRAGGKEPQPRSRHATKRAKPQASLTGPLNITRNDQVIAAVLYLMAFVILVVLGMQALLARLRT